MRITVQITQYVQKMKNHTFHVFTLSYAFPTQGEKSHKLLMEKQTFIGIHQENMVRLFIKRLLRLLRQNYTSDQGNII